MTHYKVDYDKLNALYDSINLISDTCTHELTRANEAANAIINSPSISGEGADSIKQYFSTVYGVLIKEIASVVEKNDKLFKAYKEDYKKKVDKDEHTVIDTKEIEVIRKKSEAQRKAIDSIYNEIGAVLKNINNIYSMRNPLASDTLDIHKSIESLTSNLSDQINQVENTHRGSDFSCISAEIASINQIINMHISHGRSYKTSFDKEAYIKSQEYIALERSSIALSNYYASREEDILFAERSHEQRIRNLIEEKRNEIVKLIDSGGILTLIGLFKYVASKEVREEITNNKTISDKEYSSIVSGKRIYSEDIHSYDDFRTYLYQNCSREAADSVIVSLSMTGDLASVDFEGIKMSYRYSGTTSSSFEKSAKSGVLEIHIPGKKGSKSTSVDIEVGTAEAGALGKLKHKTKYKLKPGSTETEKTTTKDKVTNIEKDLVDAKIGGAAEGMKMKITTKKGNSKFDTHDSVEINVGDVEAMVGLSANSHGISANAGAFANAASIKKSKGITVFGTKADVWAGAYAGAGAHADGKLGLNGMKGEAYVAAGGGLGGGFEIDNSDAIERLSKLKRKEIPADVRKYKAGGEGLSRGGGGQGAFGM